MYIQSMTKWSARFALGLSNSVPGLQVKEECIHEVNDIVCAAFNRQGKVPSQMVMTDGCGLTSRNVLRALAQLLGWSDVPTAIQMRLAGAKVSMHCLFCLGFPYMAIMHLGPLDGTPCPHLAQHAIPHLFTSFPDQDCAVRDGASCRPSHAHY